jgi:thermitase
VKKQAALISILFIISFSSYTSPFLWGKETKAMMNPAGFVPDEFIIKFDEKVSTETIKRLTRRAEADVISEIDAIGAFVLRVPIGGVDAAISDLSQQADVVYVEPNYYVSSTEIAPNDPGWGDQYNMTAIRAPAGWALNTGAVWVTIAILDTGVDLAHPDLFVRILPGYDFVNNDNDPQDDHGHGTHVAAIAAASTNNGEGVAGVNWGANILPVKVLNSSATGTYANVAAGIVWATDNGAQVINLSLGGPAPSFVLNDAVNYAYQRGVILVASTGNAGAPSVLYPAAYDPVIAVGATDSGNNLAGFSNYGPEVDVVAPGVNIYSAFPGGGYGYRSGTSMAAPHVSGLAALLWGIPGNGPTRIRALIEASTLDLGSPGWDVFFGSGLIQMDAAILPALPTATPEATKTLEPTQTTVSLQRIDPPPHVIAVTTTLIPAASQVPSPFQTASQAPFYIASETQPPASDNMTTATLTAQVHAAEEVGGNDWLGCSGVGLILLGVFLFWLAKSDQKRRFR